LSEVTEQQKPNRVVTQPEEPGYWWVNQNRETYQAEKAGYYLFAPHLDKLGKERIQYKNMAELKPDDICLHYSEGAIKAVSHVIEMVKQGKRPVLLTSLPGEELGQVVRSSYIELDSPIQLREISLELRLTYSGETFNRKGNPNVRYLTQLRAEFTTKLCEQFPDLASKF